MSQQCNKTNLLTLKQQTHKHNMAPAVFTLLQVQVCSHVTLFQLCLLSITTSETNSLMCFNVQPQYCNNDFLTSQH